MAIRINFDSTHNANSPTYILATRNGRRLGKLPAYNITFKDTLNSYSEVFFRVNKNDTDNKLWNQIKDFKLMYCKEYNLWFEIYVEINESNHSIKNVTAKSLGEVELSQINLYGIEINTETDISRDEYKATVLYDELDPKTSLLNRIMEKAPHYRIKHVDSSIANIQRTFSFDSTTLYDAFQKIAEEINCLFVIKVSSDIDGTISRTVEVYDLEAYCLACGNRDEFSDICPECGSENILHGYGQDTTIFVSTENLASEIQYSTNVDSVKNCFKLTAGDDLMTATLANCNPNGSSYIWYISDESKEDMSEDLVSRLKAYDLEYERYQLNHEIVIASDLLSAYNDLVEKYSAYSDTIELIPTSIVGYPKLMNAYYNTIDMHLFLNSELMPNVKMQDTTAADEALKLNAGNLSPVSVQDIKIVSSATATSAVLAMAKTIIDPRYQVRVKESGLDELVWSGSFIVTNYSDEEDTATSSIVDVEINDDYEAFVKQKLDKALSNTADDNTDIVSLFKNGSEDFANELKKYSLSRLQSFHDSCQACLDILIEQGISNQDSDLYQSIYIPYYDKLSLLSHEINVRESEIAIVIGSYNRDGHLVSNGVQTVLENERNTIQSALDFERFLGEDLWIEFVAYRREDTYQNDNYISDGLNNAELFDRALEFIKVAKKDIYKSATLQHSITATLKNLLAMKEFAAIVNYFEVGNWIRIRVDGNVYKLRIIEYEIDYENFENISIVFSDVQNISTGISDIENILNQASSMSTSYGAVSRQAVQGAKTKQNLDGWVTNGLALTKMKIIDSADNQNITFDSHGLLCKEYSPITDDYSDKQLKLINRGIYLTDDNWLTSRAGIGDFTFYNPATGKMEETYGVIADTLVGNLILSEKVGIYNTKNSITLDENGVVITADGTGGDSQQTAFTIQKRSKSENGDEYMSEVMYIDADGNLVLNGTIRINASTDDTIATINDLASTSRYDEALRNELYREPDGNNDGDTGGVYPTINAKYKEMQDYADMILHNYDQNLQKYMTFDSGVGLTLGAEGSSFKTVIDHESLKFQDGDRVVSYISGEQLHIVDAVIENCLLLGHFFFSPRDDGGVSLTWQDEI